MDASSVGGASVKPAESVLVSKSQRVNRSKAKASKVTALGVTINSNVPFTFVATGTGTLAVGRVFIVVNNTSANPIFGTFSNLPNGSTFTSNGNNFQVSYTGGTGNDLTLTVVP